MKNARWLKPLLALVVTGCQTPCGQTIKGYDVATVDVSDDEATAHGSVGQMLAMVGDDVVLLGSPQTPGDDGLVISLSWTRTQEPSSYESCTRTYTEEPPGLECYLINDDYRSCPNKLIAPVDLVIDIGPSQDIVSADLVGADLQDTGRLERIDLSAPDIDVWYDLDASSWVGQITLDGATYLVAQAP